MSARAARRYLLVDQIGAGGMGAVWRAWDVTGHRFVAAKVLPAHAAPTASRLVHEQSVRVGHPHVVSPEGWVVQGDSLVLVMDLVRGGSVDRLLVRHGPLPEDYVAVLLDQLLAALEAVHADGLVHRDVKPGNLLLEPTGTGRPLLRLADFGVATTVTEPAARGAPTSVGTDGYLAPEVRRGTPPDPRHDLYAAGVTAVELLTGRRPGGPADASPGRLRPLLTALLDPDPAARPPSAGEARAWLGRLGVPQDAPWRERPHAPDVADRLGEVAVPAAATTRRTTWAAVACFVGAIAICALVLALTLLG